ncbi:MAG: PQQ-dependent sugar dehydrogenase [Actinomycetota bacterium]|nr:PQQ-dependent sugar dehydrogenase [Actinomycetota bacterium]
MRHRGSRSARLRGVVLVGALLAGACGQGPDEVLTRAAEPGQASSTSSAAPTTSMPPPAPTATPSASPTTEPAVTPGTDDAPGGGTPSPPEAPGARSLKVTEVARGLDTVWAMAFDPDGRLWFTERGGRLTRLGEPSRDVAGVVESGEGGLMGLEIDGRGRVFVMYTSATDNRVVRLEPDGSQTVLVDGIARAAIHNGGRLSFGPQGSLYAATGDAATPELAQDQASRNGKVLRIDPDGGGAEVFTSGHRNVQGLCADADGRLRATEHGPDRGDEVNTLTAGFNGGWPGSVGTGIQNYTPTIAPAGCAVYTGGLISSWQGSMLFVTLKGQDLRRLTFGVGGSVTGEEVLFDGDFGRLRDVAVAPDGSVYLATSNRDGRGSPVVGDDRILRVAPG